MKKRTAFLIMAIILAFSAAAPAYAALTTTTASPAAAWYAEAAEKYGYQDVFGAFEPNRPVTRMEFAHLLQKVFKLAPQKNGGDDAETILSALAVTGIVSQAGSFDAKGVLGRAEMAHWVIKTLDYLTGGQYAMVMIMPEPFADDALIPDAFMQSVTKAVILKLVYGRGDNVFDPLTGATCAEAVVMVSRLAALAESLMPDVSVRAGLTRQNGSLIMSLSMTNHTNEPVVINHPSAQRYDFHLYDAADKLLYSWSLGRMFALILGTTEIAPGATVTFTETLDADALKAIEGDIAYMKAYITGTSEVFAIPEDGYIAYPAG